MSHFSVLVIGENVDEQMAPYQENNMGLGLKEAKDLVEAFQGTIPQPTSASRSLRPSTRTMTGAKTIIKS